MRLSDNFKELLLEMEKQAFTMPVYNKDGDCLLGSNFYLCIKHPIWKRMFLFEESDFDKAIAIYGDKNYSSYWHLKQLEETKQYLKARDFVYGDDFYKKSAGTNLCFFEVENFVSNLYSHMVYRKKDAGREKVREILDEYWYSQSDYQVFKDAMWDVQCLINYWANKRTCIEREAKHQARYKSLVGALPAF